MAIKISNKLEGKINKSIRDALWAMSQQKQLPTNQEVLDYLANLVVGAVADHNAEVNAKCRTVIDFPK